MAPIDPATAERNNWAHKHAKDFNLALVAISLAGKWDTEKGRVGKTVSPPAGFNKHTSYNKDIAELTHDKNGWFLILQHCNLFVIDIDTVGTQTIDDVLTPEGKAFLEKHCIFKVRTQSGGMHYYFLNPPGISYKKTTCTALPSFSKMPAHATQIDLLTDWVIFPGTYFDYNGKRYSYDVVDDGFSNLEMLVEHGVPHADLQKTLEPYIDEILAPKPSTMTYSNLPTDIMKQYVRMLKPWRAGPRGDWLKTVWCIATAFNKSAEGLEMAHEFSKLGPKYDAEDVQKKYYEANGKKGLGSLKKFALEDNPAAYKALHRQLAQLVRTHWNENDKGLGYIFAEMMREDLVCTSMKKGNIEFYHFDSNKTLWRPMNELSVHNLFVQRMPPVIQNYIDEINAQIQKSPLAESDGKKKKHPLEIKRDDVIKVLKNVQKTSFAKSCLAVYADLLFNEQFIEKLNPHKDLLSVANGVVELRTKTLRERRREDYFSYALRVNYKPDAPRDIWMKFFNEILNFDSEQVFWLMMFIGYALTGEVSEQIFLIAYGPRGGNGKSVLLELLTALFEEDVLFSTFNKHDLHVKADERNESLARSQHKRLCAVSETAENEEFDIACLKGLTGGDTISARVNYGSLIKFIPQFKLMFLTNKLPEFDAHHEPIWRRLRMLVFNVQFMDRTDARWKQDLADKGLIRERDPLMAQKLRDNLEGLLAIAVEHAAIWYSKGLPYPESMQKALREFRADTDRVQEWLKERVEISNGSYIVCRELNDQCFCGLEDTRMKKQKVSEQIGTVIEQWGGKKGTEYVNGVKTKVWKGVRMITAETSEDPVQSKTPRLPIKKEQPTQNLY